MGWTRVVWASCLVVTAASGAARAQPGGVPAPTSEAPLDPAPPPPTGPPPDEPAPVGVSAPLAPTVPPVEATSVYPRELALRPLMLPGGALEGSLMFTLQNISTGSSDSRNSGVASPRFRYSFGVAEAEVGVSLLAYETEDTSMFPIEGERFQSLFAAGRFKVSSSVVVGAELNVFTPAADFKTYSPRALAATKLMLSRASAVEIAVRTGVDRNSSIDLMGMSFGGISTFVLSSEVRLQAQVTPGVAIEARALLGYYNPDGDPSTTGVPSSYFAQTYGLRVVGTVTPDVDLIAGFDVTNSTGDATVKVFSVGVAARRVP